MTALLQKMASDFSKTCLSLLVSTGAKSVTKYSSKRFRFPLKIILVRNCFLMWSHTSRRHLALLPNFTFLFVTRNKTNFVRKRTECLRKKSHNYNPTVVYIKIQPSIHRMYYFLAGVCWHVCVCVPAPHVSLQVDINWLNKWQRWSVGSTENSKPHFLFLVGNITTRPLTGSGKKKIQRSLPGKKKRDLNAKQVEYGKGENFSLTQIYFNYKFERP